MDSASRDTKARKRADTIDVYRPAKRRKVSGLNTRFNRMIKSINPILPYGNRSPAVSRKRIQFSETSSVSSHDIPKTPMNDQDSLYAGNLGKDFSVLKMNVIPQNDSDGFSKPVAPLTATKDPLPVWLAQTFYSLEAHHPLRGLLSPSHVGPAQEYTGRSNSASIESLGASHEEDVFAFSPFDKEGETGHRPEGTLRVPDPGSAVAPTEPTLPHLQLKMSATDPLPFSTPGRFAPARRSKHSPVVGTSFHKRLAPEIQQMNFHNTTDMHLAASFLAHLRRGDVIGPSRITKSSSNLVQDNGPPSDLQAHGINTNHSHQGFRGGPEQMGVFATPGPTFASSRPVYFNSPTEDPSLLDPLEPDSYQLDLDAIDFRWRPFPRSDTPGNENNRRPVSPSSPGSLGYAVHDPLTRGNQSGWNARCAVDKLEHGASSEDLPCLSEDVNAAYLNDLSALRPSNVNTTQSGPISHAIGPCQWSSPINDVQQVWPPFAPQGVLLSPLRDQPEPVSLAASHVPPRGDEENIHTSKESDLLHGEDMNVPARSVVYGTRPSTPIRQALVSPPSTPQKLRSSSQLCDMPRAPVRKTYSALSWMIPLKPSKRTVAAQGGVNRRLPCVSANSRDSIESWSETS